eukprot:sb/3469500/
MIWSRSIRCCRSVLWRPLYHRCFSTTSAESIQPTTQVLEIDKETQNRIRLICGRYSPIQYRLAMPFAEYASFKHKLKMWKRVVGVGGYTLGIFVCVQISPLLIPQITTGEPIALFGIEGLDPMFVGMVGATIVGILSAWMSFAAYPTVRLTLSGAEVKGNYLERERDLNRRLNKYRCIEQAEVGQDDDYYGDKIRDLSDYRYWVRVQQMKHESATKRKEAKLFQFKNN